MLLRLLPAVILNLSAGLLYAWNLFLLPLERTLEIDRGSLSLVPSFALTTFTYGMVLCPWLLIRVGYRCYLIFAYALMSLGFIAFGQVPSYGTLLISYGVAFGLAAGLAYGLALVFATSVPDSSRPLSIGVAMASFALCGILMPPLLGELIATNPPHLIFTSIGLACIVPAVLIQILVGHIPNMPVAKIAESNSKGELLDADFVKLFVIFFFLCFVGLMSVSQMSGITSTLGVKESAAGRITSFLTIGYLLGSLSGGWMAEHFGGRNTLIAAGIAMVAGIATFAFASAIGLLYFGAIAIGAAFGGSASFMPMLISARFGAARVSEVYGKMMIAYGAAGLIAPWLTGSLYSASQSYVPGLTLAAFMAVSAIAIGLTLKSRPGTISEQKRQQGV